MDYSNLLQLFNQKQQNLISSWAIRAVLANDMFTDDSFVVCFSYFSFILCITWLNYDAFALLAFSAFLPPFSFVLFLKFLCYHELTIFVVSIFASLV